MSKYYFFITFLGFVVLILLAVGFSIVGSPISQQALNQDTARLDDFRELKYQIEDYYRKNGVLPSSLSDLPNTARTKDPVTNKIYEYKIETPAQYKLCSEFSTDSTETKDANSPLVPPVYYDKRGNSNGEHKKGYDCILYDMPDYVIKPPPMDYYQPPATYLQTTPQPTATPAANAIKLTGLYSSSSADSFAAYITLNINSKPTIIYSHKAKILDKSGLDTSLSNFKIGDIISIEAPIMRGDAYEASIIQNTTR